MGRAAAARNLSVLTFLFLTGMGVPTHALGESSTPEAHLVFDVSGTLVQQIPRKNASQFPDSEILKTSAGVFRIYPKAQAALRRLAARPGVKISFFSELPAQVTSEILQGAGLSDLAHQTLSQNARALSSVSKDSTDIVVIDDDTEKTSVAPAVNTVAAGKALFAFPTFEAAQAELARIKKEEPAKLAELQKRIPATRQEWEANRDRFARLYQVLSDSLAQWQSGGGKNLAALARARALSGNAALDVKKGTEQLTRFVEWETKDGKIQGCLEKDSTDKAYAKAAPATRCTGELPILYDWIDDKSSSCGIFTEKHVLIARAELTRCLERAPIRYQWSVIGKTKRCALHTPGGVFVRAATPDRCADLPEPDCDCKPDTAPLPAKATASLQSLQKKLLSEILALQDGAAIPFELYQKYDSRVIGASIVARIQKRNDSAPAQKPDYDFWKDTQIQMAFEEKYFDSIQKNCFLNQHQVGTSKGILNPKHRARQESSMAGLELETPYQPDRENPVHRVRPKYAFLGIQSPRSAMSQSLINQYGNVIAVFKDEVKSRSTFTPGDSLEIGAEITDTHSFHFRSDQALAQRHRYYETQIWGEVCLQDVAHFLVGCDSDRPVTPETRKKLQATGIPVHKCVVTDANKDGFPEKLEAGKRL